MTPTTNTPSALAVFALWYNEGPGTTRYQVYSGTSAECDAFQSKWNNSHARWERIEAIAV